ncbi:MAG: hypothetical protein MRJ67_07925 [Nitrospirales bacterium]|nr:hypothetical protein [Nitrospira sp.]MDR4460430.1 hypothetical protein [Nitrospirales bacterium]MDR4484068.1 hypothetical protein [Nitrospirales bacterium]MDR4485776.1 hypothetical protein [Nitrospirales bacterium]
MPSLSQLTDPCYLVFGSDILTNRQTLFGRRELGLPPQVPVRPFVIWPNGISIDLGGRSTAFPATPPYASVPIRQSGGLEALGNPWKLDTGAFDMTIRREQFGRFLVSPF